MEINGEQYGTSGIQGVMASNGWQDYQDDVMTISDERAQEVHAEKFSLHAASAEAISPKRRLKSPRKRNAKHQQH